MGKPRPEKQYKGVWEIKAPEGKTYKGHLQWKRFYGPNDERFALFKMLPIGKKKAQLT